mgnify:CR=1 FL=1
MPLRVTAIILSLVLHGVAGVVLWVQLQSVQSQALELGEGQDIMLEPQGLDVSEVSNVGDDLQSIESAPSVPVASQAPPPAAAPTPEDIPPLSESENTVQDLDEGTPQQVAEVAPPPPQEPTRSAPELVRDAITSEESTVEQDLVDAHGPPPEALEEQRLVTAHRATAPDEVKEPEQAVRADVPLPDPLAEPHAAVLEPPPPPEEIQEEPEQEARADVPVPEALREARAAPAKPPAPPEEIKEPGLDRSEVAPSAPPAPVEEPEPDVVEVVAQPEQVVLVTEQSSGEEKKGGDASLVRIYVGKVNTRVQRAKVNPRSRRTGTVTVRFTIGTDGALVAKEVVRSSGAEVLDGAALAALERAAPFPPIPPDVSAEPMTFTQSFRFLVR